jgi:arsenite oxidase large subunit
VRFFWTIGLTWFPAMVASQDLARRVRELTVDHQLRPITNDKQHVIDMLIARADAGGMVLVDSDIYPVDPLNTAFADIVLPAACWGEEDFTRCNSERRLRLYSKFNDAPGEAKPDWWAIAGFARRMGYQGYDWTDSNAIFEESSRFSRGNVLSYHALVTEAKRQGKRAHAFLAELGTTGIQTPVRVVDGKLVGTKRLHDPANQWGEVEGVTNDARWLYEFDTHSGKALLLKTSWKSFPGWSDFYEAIKPRAAKGEIWITNGRVNETWQSGFDDLRKPGLAARWPYPHIVIHPDDAKAEGIESGDFVEAINDEVFAQTGAPIGVEGSDLTFTKLRENGHIRVSTAKVMFVALVSDEMRQGVAKAQFNMGAAMANALVPAVVDPITGNYRYKLGRGALKRVGPSPWKTSLTAMSLKPRPIV